MKHNLLIFCLVLFCFSTARSQNKKNFVGLAYQLETNIGFSGYQFSFERTLFQQKHFSVLTSYNWFSSDKIIDRNYDFADQYYRSHILDLEAQYAFSKKENQSGLRLHGGIIAISSKYQTVKSYSTNLDGTVSDIRIDKQDFDNAVGIKVGLGYQFYIQNRPFVLDLSARNFEKILFPEPTMLNLGLKIGF